MVANARSFLYWKTNPEWYDYDDAEKPYLTEKATDEAKESFKNYIKLIERQNKTKANII